MLEFQYFEGCPNANETLDNLKALLDEGIIPGNLKITEIKDISEAEVLNFQGSPTVLFDGKDIYTGSAPSSYNYTCRVYRIEGKQTGVMSKEFMTKRIKKMLERISDGY